VKLIVDGPQMASAKGPSGARKEISGPFGLIQRKSVASFYFKPFFNGRNFSQLVTVAGGDGIRQSSSQSGGNFIIQFFSITSISLGIASPRWNKFHTGLL
jgi:hypothetical protein